MPVVDIAARGHGVDVVKKVERLLYIAEYKRRQAAPGVKISSRNFGRDRRYPIVNKFREDPARSAPGSGTAPKGIIKPRPDMDV
jgi:NAD+ synthase